MKRAVYVTLVCLVCSLPGFAKVIFVDLNGGGDFTEIQPAIDAAGDGDTVSVFPGEYVITEPIHFNRQSDAVKNIVVWAHGASPWPPAGGARPEETIIRMSETPVDPDEASVVIFHNGGSTLSRFTLTGGTGTNTVLGCCGGGVLSTADASSRLIDCKIEGNSADFGGGVACFGALTVRNCTISGNSAAVGGGVAGDSLSLWKCRITGNSGSGVHCGEGSSPILTNCTITGNSERGVFCGEGSSPILTNCTIAGNSDAGVLCSLASPTLANCILWNNAEGSLVVEDGSDPNVSYSCLETQEVWPGESNINSDPLFVGSSDYHLRHSSPCIDSGTLDGAPDRDIEGIIRPYRQGIDMGAYEYSGTEFHPLIEEIVAAISQDKYTAKWQTLDDFETRFYNRPENDLAAQWIYETLESYGLEVESHFYTHEDEEGEYRNVIGTLRGGVEPDEVVYMTAHFDSTSDDPAHAPGANDNAAGVAAFLEAARVLSNYEFSRTIKFVGFNSEEEGLRGSEAYVADVAISEHVVGCFNLDVIACPGEGNQLAISARGSAGAEPLAYLVRAACETYTPEFIAPLLDIGGLICFWLSSDLCSFRGVGPAILISGGPGGEREGCSIHTQDDRIENYPNKEYPTSVTRAVTAAVAQAAMDLSFNAGVGRFVRGDCNGDGEVNVTDAQFSLNWLFAGAATPGCIAALNTNGDEAVDLADAVALLTFLFSGGSAPEAPFPHCGFGELPADQTLGCENPPQNCAPVP